LIASPALARDVHAARKRWAISSSLRAAGERRHPLHPQPAPLRSPLEERVLGQNGRESSSCRPSQRPLPNPSKLARPSGCVKQVRQRGQDRKSPCVYCSTRSTRNGVSQPYEFSPILNMWCRGRSGGVPLRRRRLLRGDGRCLRQAPHRRCQAAKAGIQRTTNRRSARGADRDGFRRPGRR